MALCLVALSLALACGGKKPDRPDGSIPDAPDGGFSSFFDRVRHLVDGDGARQRDVDLDALDPARVIRVFGYVKDDSDAVDEAESMGAAGVVFDRPVPFYVDNSTIADAASGSRSTTVG